MSIENVSVPAGDRPRNTTAGTVIQALLLRDSESISWQSYERISSVLLQRIVVTSSKHCQCRPVLAAWNDDWWRSTATPKTLHAAFIRAEQDGDRGSIHTRRTQCSKRNVDPDRGPPAPRRHRTFHIVQAFLAHNLAVLGMRAIIERTVANTALFAGDPMRITFRAQLLQIDPLRLQVVHVASGLRFQLVIDIITVFLDPIRLEVFDQTAKGLLLIGDNKDMDTFKLGLGR
ncbi:hypothetical protein L210DRAFT_3499440 [Boletus edulis BED1]|uniref:Uncharacterized protein n=1 Tax=Boletus edulis BED1 TaxID=1328754 RepID=A0AAD4GLK0_BOLED|nr:hypothetical protein L210DRAFT_3499440 [Boletus edulis BED1]